MTPNAITPAARGTDTGARRTARKSKGPDPAGSSRGSGAAVRSQTRSAGHRGAARKPLVPRRFSGPAGGVTRSASVAAPSRPARRPGRRTATKTAHRPLLAPAKAFVGSLPDHPLLDRIVRGRAWIPILGILLAGIVAMQVEVLKLSASMGRAIERATALQSRNEQLRASVASLSDARRIEQLAANMGMVMPGPEAIGFLHAPSGATLRQAIANIHQPDPAGFDGVAAGDRHADGRRRGRGYGVHARGAGDRHGEHGERSRHGRPRPRPGEHRDAPPPQPGPPGSHHAAGIAGRRVRVDRRLAGSPWPPSTAGSAGSSSRSSGCSAMASRPSDRPGRDAMAGSLQRAAASQQITAT